VSNPRAPSPAGRLAALGFADTAAALGVLTGELSLDLAGADAAVVEALAAAADPGLALTGLARLEPDQDLLGALRADAELRARLCAVLGTSTALAEHLRRHRDDWRLLAGPAAGPRPAAGQLTADLTGAASADELRRAYHRWLLRLAARDLTGEAALEEVTAGLADLAAAALQAAFLLARRSLPGDAVPCRLAVIAMGKCGGRELNYASDVDVIFVAEPADAADGDAGREAKADGEAAALLTATRLASAMIRICADPGREGSLFPVDPNLRPEGRNGPLVRTLGSHLTYYQRWAKTWEFQALLKARPVAGDAELGRTYIEAVAPLVWTAAQREDFVPDVQAMRRRVVASLPAAQAGRELKLGPGGLRDIEFAVQLLQLVHGRADATLRDRATLPALDALARGGYVGRADAASLGEAYRFLRVVEHLLQLRQLRRTHSLPTDPAILRQLGRALRQMRYPGRAEDARADPAEELTVTWRRHAATARQLHEKLFYRPLLDAVARLPDDVIRLTSQAAAARLEALGYADPAGALRHIAALTEGVSRKASIQRALLPAMLGWFADAPRPDAGLLAFRQVSEALGGSPWYLRLLRDDTNVAWRMARLLASSRYATDLLLRAPEAVAMLGDENLLRPADPAGLRTEAQALVRRHAGRDGQEGRDAAAAGLLALRRRELLRTAAADVLGLLDAGQSAAALSEVAAVTVAGALELASATVAGTPAGLPATIAVIAMGRFGGQELGYGSDADVLFLYQQEGTDEQAAARAAHATAEELRRLLGRPGPDPPLRVDADLRPEGRQGPLVRSLSAYRAYYDRWAKPWEIQALLRASPVAGDPDLGAAFAAMADELRYPAGGLPDASVREIKRIKARMEAERMPRGIDQALHLKLGPGGLSDTEWVTQIFQLRHGGAVPALRTTRTLAALTAAADAGLITAADAAALRESWLLATRIRNAIMLATGRAADVLPAGHAELSATARLLGYPPDGAQDLVQDWRRTARRARTVMERLFYG
jgi:[glutamine synthetase] adenylyltransferase / [glutamine synthetase]-adenylyl-L-tyrosine phosphorylase